ncbi:rhamnan synthesis F family protein [Pseudobutyrivibrio xylanivorans]|uniref:Haloacid dehalogenase-like hydrolase n=1 Tax=Pseudobutyrivibrio xylanivorans TaxID=185007 RepID=A0A5P6VUH2_PSEXY|nr:rhamnan synthesis F family protein [Pseudobutyrivibrio xylanivorans]QFJ56110.1 hypothetical protein FXF36_15065 [Pseudobutyrivibrio xylanivorans]
MERLLYEKLSNERNPKYNIITDIVERDGKRVVIKKPYDSQAINHIHRVFNSYRGLQDLLQGSAFCVNESQLVGDTIESEFLEGEHLTAADSQQFLDAVKSAFIPKSTEFDASDEFTKVFGEVDLPRGVLACKFLDIDLIFDNIIKTDKGWEIIDYEWTFDFLVPINYMLYRVVKFSDLPGNLVEISDEERAQYEKMEAHFQYQYCFKDVKNLKELFEHADSRSKTSADFAIASRDYQISQLQELIAAKDTHIRNIEAVNEQLRTIYDNTVNTRGYKTLESIRAFKSFLTGKQTPAREAKRAEREAAKAAKAAAREAKRAAERGEEAPSIAVHLHLFYVDLLPEFVSYFANIPYGFDLYISCQEGADVNAIRAGLKELKLAKTVDIRPLQNRGRDLAPLYVAFGSEILKHDYILHVHSKKSLYSGQEKGGWRQFSLELLLGSPEKVNSIFDMFKNKNAGLVYPDIHEEVPMIAYSWLANAGLGAKLAQEYDLGELPSVFNYPAGSFFWAKTDAIRPVFEHGYSYESFPEEAGQTDGTLAHALERILPFISRKQGYDDFILYLEDGDTRMNKSLRPFAGNFKVDKQLLIMKLVAYDVISFDIFDTLITRTVYEPDDVFRLLERIIFNKYGKKVDFLKLRKAAESAATEKYGAMTTIDKIYVEVARDKTIGDIAMDIKKLEIELETAVCIPRHDMVEVYNAMKSMGKHVILVSDMYLNRVEVVGLLHKCGIAYYDELLISCEVGARKDDGTMWNMVLANMPKDRFIHVGDNFRSDSQILMDRGVASHIVLNPRDMLTLSDFSYFGKLAKRSLADSVIVGQAVNGGIFNSPFAFDESGSLHFKSMYDFGYTTMGPLMARFTQWIVDENTKSGERLLLLAREGYMLERLIKGYCQAKGQQVPDIHYFLTSRRACAVPALENDEDIRELIKQKYQGSFSNLLWERFGLTIHDGDEDREFDYETKPETIMEALAPYKNEIFVKAKAEKTAYLNYASDFFAGASDLAVVDVGFSGTIQYFLMKLTERDIAGHYLALHSNKPERIGGRADAIFTITDPRLIDESKLLRYQLFLENALSAPFGQLINFEMKDGKPKPNFKDDDYVSEAVKQLQQGILDFVIQYAATLRSTGDGMVSDAKLVEDLFYDIIAAGTLTPEIAESLTVEDGYSRGGVQKFDVKTGAWKVE